MGKIKPITYDEVMMMFEMKDKGMGQHRIAEELNRSRNSVWKYLKFKNLNLSEEELKKTVEEASRSVRKKKPDGGEFRVTEAEIQKMNDMRDKGYTLRYISYVLKRDISTIVKHTEARVVHKEWTKEEVKVLKELVGSGITYREIAKRLGRTRDSVNFKLYFMRKTQGVNHGKSY